MISLVTLLKSIIWVIPFVITPTLPASATESMASPELKAPFQELVQAGKKKSVDLQLADTLLQKKRFQSYSSYSKYFPTAQAQITQGRLKDFTSTIGISTFGPRALETDFSRMGLAVQWPILNRSLYLKSKISYLEEKEAELAWNIALREFENQLRNLFLNWILLLKQANAIESSLELAKNQAEEANIRKGLGQKTTLDVLKIQAQVAALETKKSQNQTEKQKIESQLIQKTVSDSFTQDHFFQIEKQISAWIRSTPDFENSLLNPFAPIEPLLQKQERLFSEFNQNQTGDQMGPQNDQLRQLKEESKSPTLSLYEKRTEHGLQVQLHQAELLTASEWPDFSIQGSYQKQGLNWNSANSATGTYSIAGVLSIPFNLGGSLYFSHREKGEAQKLAEYQSIKSRESLNLQILNTANEIKNLAQLDKNQLLLVDQSKKILELTETSHRLGKATTNDLLLAQNNYLGAQLDALSTRIQLTVLIHQNILLLEN